MNKLLGEEWSDRMPELLASEYMLKLGRFLKEEYSSRAIYPNKADIFNAFKLCPFNKLKVIILGQDPYPDTVMVDRITYPRATGLAFANPDFRTFVPRMSASLEKIYDCVKGYAYDQQTAWAFDRTLISWASQGVLLLNTALTVRAGEPLSHFKYWQPFIRHIIKELSSYGSYIFLLWGKEAQKYKSIIGSNNTILEWTHPAYAAYQKIPWECTHFTEVNNILIQTNNEQIYW